MLNFAFDRKCYSAKKALGKQLWEVQYRHDGSEETITDHGKREDVGNQGGLKLSLYLQKDYDFTFRGLKNWWKTQKEDMEVYKQRWKLLSCSTNIYKFLKCTSLSFTCLL